METQKFNETNTLDIYAFIEGGNTNIACCTKTPYIYIKRNQRLTNTAWAKSKLQ